MSTVNTENQYIHETYETNPFDLIIDHCIPSIYIYIVGSSLHVIHSFEAWSTCPEITQSQFERCLDEICDVQVFWDVEKNKWYMLIYFEIFIL